MSAKRINVDILLGRYYGPRKGIAEDEFLTILKTNSFADAEKLLEKLNFMDIPGAIFERTGSGP